MQDKNTDSITVASFGSEWSRFNQKALDSKEQMRIFNQYFSIFPWASLEADAVGFDMGCGSGRWAAIVAPKVGRLVCIDPSGRAIDVSRQALAGLTNVEFLQASANSTLLRSESFDFGYSLGVLHHIPDTRSALIACVSLLKPGAPFLVYLYYRFDNRPRWFSLLWKLSELIRFFVSRLPNSAKFFLTDLLAVCLYWPMARLSGLLDRLGFNPSALPLSFYRDVSLYTMRTDCRDRFGTPLEKRFTRLEIEQMMSDAGLSRIVFSDNEPFWVAVGVKV